MKNWIDPHKRRFHKSTPQNVRAMSYQPWSIEVCTQFCEAHSYNWTNKCIYLQAPEAKAKPAKVASITRLEVSPKP